MSDAGSVTLHGVLPDEQFEGIFVPKEPQFEGTLFRSFGQTVSLSFLEQLIAKSREAGFDKWRLTFSGGFGVTIEGVK